MNPSGRILLLFLVLIMLSPWLSASNPWDYLSLTEDETSYILGNGVVLSELSDKGSLHSIVWHDGAPGINQINGRDANDRDCLWSLSLNGVACRPGDESWTMDPLDPKTGSNPVFACTGKIKGKNIKTEILCFLPDDLPAIASRMVIKGDVSGCTILWRQHFEPANLGDSPLAIPLTVTQAGRSFASFHDQKTGRNYQFRPLNPGRTEWSHARRLCRNNAIPAEWSSFNTGVWIASECRPAPSHVTLAAEESSPNSAVGNAGITSIIDTPYAADQMHAEVLIGFGNTRADADAVLNNAWNTGFDELLQQTLARRNGMLKSVLDKTRVSLQDHMELLDALHLFFSSSIHTSGTVAYPPTTAVPYSTVSPDLCAWSVMAWSRLGETSNAQRQADFLLECCNKHLNQPSGRIPILFFSDGHAAAPLFMSGPASSSWCLMACAAYCETLPPPRQKEYLDQNLSRLSLLVEYLLNSSNPTTGTPPPGFDFRVMRDTASPENELLCYLAMDAVLRMTGQVSISRQPEWRDWRRELEVLLRFRLLNNKDPWNIPPSLAAWSALHLPEGNSLRDAPVRLGDKLITLGNCTLKVATENISRTNVLTAAIRIAGLPGQEK